MIVLKNKKYYNKKTILIYITFLIIIFILLSITNSNKNQQNENKINQSPIIENNISEEERETKEDSPKEESTNITKIRETNEEKLKKYSWGIYIPKINLIAKIQNGTTDKVMNEHIGHFEETSTLNGNIGLAAHNRGYPVNYFANLKELQIGDEIIYKYNENIRKYKVSKKTIIEDTDWSYLEDTKENTITLITCVENKPSYRRCVQAIEET